MQLVFYTFKVMKKKILILFSFFCFLPFTKGQELQQNVSLASYISIFGTSNINKFNLDFEFKDVSKYSKIDKNEKVTLKVPIKNFTASKKMIYKDFLSLVNQEVYPNLIIEFDLDQINDTYLNYINCKITLSGVSNEYSIPVFCSFTAKDQLYIKGNKQINLTSFSLTPPEKLFKLIKVDDVIDINFALHIEENNL